MKKSKKINRVRLIEFFIVGVVCGVIEDLIAIMLVTDGGFEWRHLFVAIVVALPFAVVSEIVVDHPDFWKKILSVRFFNRENNLEIK
jgi:hypothetical protein